MKKKHRKKLIIVLVIIIVMIIILGVFEIKEVKERSESGDLSIEIFTKLFTDEESENEEDADAEGSSSQNTANGNVSENAGSANSEASSENKTIQFPYTIENTSLVIQKVRSYDGSYVEDGSNTEITGVTAILVKNAGDECVEYADITLKSESQELKFSLSALEAGGSCIILEANGVKYSSQSYLSCTAEVALLQTMEMSEDIVEVTETAAGALNVKNISDEMIPCIRIFYKYYDNDEKLYIGGIAYMAKITDLKAGFSQLVTPSHYVAGQSKIVMVRTYDSNE